MKSMKTVQPDQQLTNNQCNALAKRQISQSINHLIDQLAVDKSINQWNSHPVENQI